MCDYSLQGLPNRLAVDGEQLITYRFRTGSMGLASPGDIAARTCAQQQATEHRSWWSAVLQWLDGGVEKDEVPAVCVPPGTRLLMNHVPERMRRDFNLNAVEEVTFVQLSAEAFQFRDAIRFGDGRQLLLQSFPSNVTFQVLRTTLHCEPGEEQTEQAAWPASVSMTPR
jgi:hypothetical protein